MNGLRKKGAVGIVAVLAGCSIPNHAEGADRLESYGQARKTVEHALRAHGGVESIQESGLTITLQGTFDLSVRLQGRHPNRYEPTPIREQIVVKPAGRHLAYEIDWFNYFSSNQKLREIYDHEGRVLFLDLQARNGGYLPRATVVDAQERFRRVAPNLLLFDALNQRRTLQHIGQSRDGRARYDNVSYVTEAGETLVLRIDRRSKLLAGATAIIDMPLLGDTEVEWRWDRYREVSGLRVPERFRTYLGGKILKDTNMSVALGADPAAFRAPEDFSVGPKPESLAPLGDFLPYGQRDPIVETLAEGVYMIKDLRPGFGLMFVEFEDFVLAVDAPTGWYEMQQMPPMSWSHGDSTSALGEKYLRAVNSTVPDKPVRFLVLSHHHSDHIGGVRPFVAEGVEILAGAGAADMTRKAASAEFTLAPDALTGSAIDPKITIVDGEHVVRDDTREVRLIELPEGNPKADGYLMVYLPLEKILYTTAFIYPIPEAVFPPPESIDLSIYFVEWLDQSGLDVEKIYNVHGDNLVETWQLEKIRKLSVESDNQRRN